MGVLRRGLQEPEPPQQAHCARDGACELVMPEVAAHDSRGRDSSISSDKGQAEAEGTARCTFQ